MLTDVLVSLWTTLRRDSGAGPGVGDTDFKGGLRGRRNLGTVTPYPCRSRLSVVLLILGTLSSSGSSKGLPFCPDSLLLLGRFQGVFLSRSVSSSLSERPRKVSPLRTSMCQSSSFSVVGV